MDLPSLALCLVPAGRHLTFVKQPKEKVNVYRRATNHGSSWELVARNAASPFVDLAGFAADTPLEYHVQHFTMDDVYLGHSPIVRVVVS